jgi:reactive chlorine resistance protein C
MFDPIWEGRLQLVGTVILRYGLAFIFLRFGIYKFVPSGVMGVEVWTARSLLLFWVDPLLGPSGGRALIGVIEIVTGILIALRPVSPRLSVFGSLMAAFAMLNTLSFLFTTPGLDARGSGFLIKDLVLLGAAIWSAAEASSAFRNQRTVRANATLT